MVSTATSPYTHAKVRATLRYLRVSPRKVRAVADLLRNKWVWEAEDILANQNRNAALPLRKLLASASANAVHNNHWSLDKLFVREVFVDGGPMFSRFMPRARGSAAEIQKKTSHVTIVLAQKEGGAARNAKPVRMPGESLENKKSIAPKIESGLKKQESKHFSPTQEKNTPTKNISGMNKRFFSRKAM